MLAQDIAPNRLEKSKEVLQDFISKIQTDRVGMVVFA
jgi:Ca-activated chloride channel family protein